MGNPDDRDFWPMFSWGRVFGYGTSLAYVISVCVLLVFYASLGYWDQFVDKGVSNALWISCGLIWLGYVVPTELGRFDWPIVRAVAARFECWFMLVNMACHGIASSMARSDEDTIMDLIGTAILFVSFYTAIIFLDAAVYRKSVKLWLQFIGFANLLRILIQDGVQEHYEPKRLWSFWTWRDLALACLVNLLIYLLKHLFNSTYYFRRGGAVKGKDDDDFVCPCSDRVRCHCACSSNCVGGFGLVFVAFGMASFVFILVYHIQVCLVPSLFSSSACSGSC